MAVVCLFLNFVPLCKFLSEQQFLCNTNLWYRVTLLSVGVFQRLGGGGWGLSEESSLPFKPLFLTLVRLHHFCTFLPALQLSKMTVRSGLGMNGPCEPGTASSCVGPVLVHATSLLGPVLIAPRLALLLPGRPPLPLSSHLRRCAK